MPSILDAMRRAGDVSRVLAMRKDDERCVLKFEEVVFLATLGGAGVLDMREEIGSFEEGKWFDALVVDVKDVVGVSRELWESEEGNDGGDDADGAKERAGVLVKKWVYCGDDRSIRKVYVGGKVVAGHDSGL